LSRAHFTDYDETTTARCERALVTLLGDIGPWRERIYLVGGLAPRYLVGKLPEGARGHVGTTDIDLVIGLALGDETVETYRTLQNNLQRAQFEEDEPSFRWTRAVDGVNVVVEFLCDTQAVPAGWVFRPKAGLTGSRVAAFNVRGAHLVGYDFIERVIESDRLDDGGASKVTVRVANLLPYTVLKILAFQDRHENKDAYDVVFCLLNFGEGPDAAGLDAAHSAIARDARVTEAIELLAERFSDVDQDGPVAYGAFLAASDDPEEAARLRREAVATVGAFLAAFRTALA
jgi:predicted nucleotidyltransferase